MESQHPFSARSLMRGLSRAFDDRPLWAQLNITWKCNLDCAYCSEYDNSRGHVPTEELQARIVKCAELGTLHTDFIGGEPLLHPDLDRLIAMVRERDMTTGMTTNGFLLSPARLDALIRAGLGRLQISVDALAPRPGVPKSLKTLLGRIEMVASRKDLWFRVNLVLCPETLEDVPEVAERCFAMGVGVNVSVVHDRGRLFPGPLDQRYRDVMAQLRQRKLEGAAVDTPYLLMDYYDRTLAGEPPDWTCLGGTKCFYVMPDGEFRFCSHVGTGLKLTDVTPGHLAAFRGPKGCEAGCGIDCVIQTSLPFSRRAGTLAVESRERLTALGRRLRHLPVLQPIMRPRREST